MGRSLLINVGLVTFGHDNIDGMMDDASSDDAELKI